MRYKNSELIIPNAPLKKGDRNLGTMYLQLALQRVLKLTGKHDIVKSENGYFGPKTEFAVQKFQSTHHLHSDGRYTEPTQKVLREVLHARNNNIHKQ